MGAEKRYSGFTDEQIDAALETLASSWEYPGGCAMATAMGRDVDFEYFREGEWVFHDMIKQVIDRAWITAPAQAACLEILLYRVTPENRMRGILLIREAKSRATAWAAYMVLRFHPTMSMEQTWLIDAICQAKTPDVARIAAEVLRTRYLTADERGALICAIRVAESEGLADDWRVVWRPGRHTWEQRYIPPESVVRTPATQPKWEEYPYGV